MKELYKRYGDVLDVILHHLREGRDHEAAAVVNAVPDEEIRSFAFFLAQHIERDLGVLGDEIRYRVEQEERLTRPSQN